MLIIAHSDSPYKPKSDKTFPKSHILKDLARHRSGIGQRRLPEGTRALQIRNSNYFSIFSNFYLCFFNYNLNSVAKFPFLKEKAPRIAFLRFLGRLDDRMAQRLRSAYRFLT
jgi:hypothetical protein